MKTLIRCRRAIGLTFLLFGALPVMAQTPRETQQAPRTQRGEASFYGPQFSGRRTASGGRFDPNSNMAAHRTLPLGTVARVTNLENGRSATVRIEDRGPYFRGRIVDLSPRTAERLGMREAGVAPVEVTPLRLPER